MATSRRRSLYLPTPAELVLLAGYSLLLLLGFVFSPLPSPNMGPGPSQEIVHLREAALEQLPYFASKDNALNILFVKCGWAWITASFILLVWTHPGFESGARRGRALARWVVVTAWWILVTQWFFGPSIIDRVFWWSGGKCIGAEAGGRDAENLLTTTACKRAGGRWEGGFDISGHVFLLVLGSCFLIQEVGWVIIMDSVEAKRKRRHRHTEKAARRLIIDAIGYGGSLAVAVVCLSVWMLLITALYFHTWFEKLYGFAFALAGLYVAYVLPRWVPGMQHLMGLPDI